MKKRKSTIKSICLLLILVLLTIALSVVLSIELNSVYFNNKEKVIEDVNRYIENGQYRDVEEIIDRLVKLRSRVDGKSLLKEIYSSVYENRNKNITEEVLNNWCSVSSHYSALVFRATYLVSSGWRIRGSGYAYTVSDKKFKLFKNKLRKAKIDLEKAYTIKPEDPNISALMIRVCTGLGLDRKEMERAEL